MFRFLRDYYPILAIALVMLWSAWSVASYRLEQSPPGTVTIRLAHYQLEAGVRDAFDVLIKDYEKIHPNIRVVQDSIPEAGYGQWVTTQLVGGTAPDIIELNGGVMTPAIMAVYATRYFKNLSETVNRPNPYNAGTDLENVPLRSTYKDGMRSSYIEEAQRFVAVPLSAQGIKVFYNKDLLKKLTGRDRMPSEYRDFLAVCREIATHNDVSGQPIVPIACSKFHINQWNGIMFQLLTYRNLFKADFNEDMALGGDEFYVAYRSGRMSLRDPANALCFQMMREVSAFFPSGWAGLQRDEALFRFAQQRAVFMSAYTQEAFSLFDLAQGKFEVGIADAPQPSQDDPVYGKLVEGPRWEKPDDTFRFVVTRFSNQQDVAQDFLLFLSSRQQNEKFNAIAHWVPCIAGAQTPTFLKEFDPHLEGVLAAFQTGVGVDTSTRWSQLLSLYQNNNISYDELVTQFDQFLKTETEPEYFDRQREARRDQSRDETVATTERIVALGTTDPAEAESAWTRYTLFLRTRLMEPNYQWGLLNHELKQKPSPDDPGPYEYTPGALARVRARLQREAFPTPSTDIPVPDSPLPSPAP